ncbi:MAG TPA: CRISPR-associated endoribonuclease Cas6 [Bacteroidales bacterium]|jgi:CRISPR-associated endoribonuclease Cas6|nr:CRISPR-associated endoribonuclease Cas6 [Bacteroidota bacterium]HHU98485.1 CRISPR-associated endoribonuclease Cas6 [Bacteroidales bacterium]HOU97043.1 CRISPR-associated endoribonuclease Cas6 [Bacteroidales bacterium]
MRFRITFNRDGRQRMLPMDYQYYLSAWIYKVIGKADREFSRFLHSEGYTDGNKRFKLFCYSPLSFEKHVLWKERALFEIRSDSLSMMISFFIPEAAGHFIEGLFVDQEVYIGDKFNGLDLAVTRVERLHEGNHKGIVKYKALSPIVISYHYKEGKYSRYLSPDDEGYFEMVKNNLVQKVKVTHGLNELSENIGFIPEPGKTPKSKLVTIKPFTREESRVRGFLYEFSLNAPAEIHHLIQSAGFGEKNSMGFGWVEV